MEADQTTKLKTEDLNLHIRRKDFKNALILAMELDHPMKLLKIFEEIHNLQEPNSISGSQSVDEYLQTLTTENVFNFVNLVEETLLVHQGMDNSLKVHSHCSTHFKYFAKVSLPANGLV